MNAAGYSAKAHPVGMHRPVENGTPYAQRHPVGWGVKNLGSLFKKLRSDFVVNVLRTTQFICRIRSIDMFSLREIRIIARRAFISIENEPPRYAIARRAFTNGNDAKRTPSLRSAAKQSRNRHEIPHSVRNDGARGLGKKGVERRRSRRSTPPSLSSGAPVISSEARNLIRKICVIL